MAEKNIGTLNAFCQKQASCLLAYRDVTRWARGRHNSPGA